MYIVEKNEIKIKVAIILPLKPASRPSRPVKIPNKHKLPVLTCLRAENILGTTNYMISWSRERDDMKQDLFPLVFSEGEGGQLQKCHFETIELNLTCS